MLTISDPKSLLSKALLFSPQSSPCCRLYVECCLSVNKNIYNV